MIRSLWCFCLLVVAAVACGADKPNILVIWGDDIGMWNISHNNRGMMGYSTPNIDRDFVMIPIQQMAGQFLKI